jgi:endonuclease YncB( thermonuclease family)
MHRPPRISLQLKGRQRRRSGGKAVRRKNAKPSRTHRRLRFILLLLLGITAAQYVTTGSVSWPGAFWRGASESVRETVSNPDAGWRHAADKLETLGAAREGDPVPDFDLSGRVVRVADGDTVSVLDKDNGQHKVRLFGIDTPEQDQPYGSSSRRALMQLVDNRTVGVVVVETDDYGRKVGTLYLEGTNINVAMVEGGHAWWYRYYAPHERRLAAAEAAAREQRLGLWAAPKPVPPWDWRKRRR